MQGTRSQQFRTCVMPICCKPSRLLAAIWPPRKSQPSRMSEASATAWRTAKGARRFLPRSSQATDNTKLRPLYHHSKLRQRAMPGSGSRRGRLARLTFCLQPGSAKIQQHRHFRETCTALGASSEQSEPAYEYTAEGTQIEDENVAAGSRKGLCQVRKAAGCPSHR